MSNSPLVNYTRLTSNCNKPRKAPISKITIHHMAGNLTVEKCGEIFNGARQVSSNYSIGTDGRVGMYVEEANRSWCSSSPDNDHQAITIEVANDGGAPNWHVSDEALAKLIDLCVDICKRNGIAKLNFTGNKDGNLTMHKYFTATQCPGPYLSSKFPYIAEEVNKRLSAPQNPATGSLLRVQVGAYMKKANADVALAQIKKAGFPAIMVKVADIFKIQVGAFSVPENADAMLKKVHDAGFSGFITSAIGDVVTSTDNPTYVPAPPAKRSVAEIAKEVIAGKWGVGDARKKKLMAAGYNYLEVQQEVNRQLK